MLNSTILWVQSPDHLADDFVYVNGIAINNEHPNHSGYVKEVLSVDYNSRLFDNGSLSIYRCGINGYHIVSNFIDKDDSGRRLAFIAKIETEDNEEVASSLEQIVKKCGYHIENEKISIIEASLKKKPMPIILSKTSIQILLTIAIATVGLILVCQKCSIK